MIADSSDFCIIVDTREVRPYRFPNVPILFQALPTGDYSVRGFLDQIAIERKAHGDMLSSLGHGRERFIKEMERLSKFKVKVLMIETTMDALFRGTHPFQKRMKPEAVVGSLVKILVDYGISIIPAGGYRYASELTLKILRRFYELQRGIKVTSPAQATAQVIHTKAQPPDNEMVQI